MRTARASGTIGAPEAPEARLEEGAGSPAQDGEREPTRMATDYDAPRKNEEDQSEEIIE